MFFPQILGGRQDGAEKLSVGGYELQLLSILIPSRRGSAFRRNCLPNAISHVTYRLKAADDEIFLF